MWTACRHHMGEIVLTHVWDSLKTEASSGPDISLFKRFQANFHILTVDDLTDLTFDSTVLDIDTADILSLLHNQQLLDNVRDDYRELLDLSIVYLAGSVKTVSGFSFKQPGALYKARWMSKLLYAIKLVLFPAESCLELHGVQFSRETLKARSVN